MADEAKETKVNPDFILPDGTDIHFDLSLMTYGQWKGLFDPKESDETSDQTICRVANITPLALNSLSFNDYRRLFGALLKRSRDPLTDPNA